MPAKIYYDNDADLAHCSKTKPSPSWATDPKGTHKHRICATVAARSSSVSAPAGPNYDLAVSHGFEPISAADATEAS